MNKWVIRKKNGNARLLSETMGVTTITSQVLINRGLLSEDLVDEFINTSLTKLKDFKEALGVVDAIEVIKESIKNNELITIYGDYDVDGVTSTTILYKTLKALTDNVNYFLPSRHKDGYGLNIKRIDELINNGTKLIITCDNGISSLVENDYIQKNGLKQIVIDHHEEPQDIPEKYLKPNAIIDPKQKECTYHFKEMCAGGLCYRFSLLLLEAFNKKVDFLDELLVFASIATVCDIVTLTYDNRIIVKEGLEKINENKEINLGLNQILRKKDLLNKAITAYTFGFVIGPTINVAGRLSEAMEAVDLFVSTDFDKVDLISTELYELNVKRQQLTKESTTELLHVIEETHLYNQKIIIIYSENIDEAVAGIVCGRIKETFNRPTIILTDSSDEGVLKASCRSISVYDMHEELSKVSNYFLRFGGHKMAAGFSIRKSDYTIFKETLLNNCTLTDDDFLKTLAVDDILSLDKIRFNEAQNLEILSPYGIGNQEPLFASLKCKVTFVRLIEEKNTLILSFIDESTSIEVKSIAFSLVDQFKNIVEDNFEPYTAKKILNGILRDVDLMLDIVYYININEFNGKQSVQLKLEDFRYSSK